HDAAVVAEHRRRQRRSVALCDARGQSHGGAGASRFFVRARLGRIHIAAVGAVLSSDVARCRCRGQRPRRGQQAAGGVTQLRLLAWNIRQGGGTRLAAIGDALAGHDADILVISEYRGGDSANRLGGALAGLGYRHATTLVPPLGKNGVLIAARHPFREHGPVSDAVPEPYRMVRVEFEGLLLCGIYMPNLLRKVPYWEALVGRLAGDADGNALAIGDFNTCRAYVDEPGAIDATAHFIDKVEATGFCDLWRRRYPD